MTTVAGAAVVVGVDGSPQSMDAVEAAAVEAARRHRPLQIVHALAWPALPVPLPPGMTQTSPGAVREQAAGYLAEAARIAGEVAADITLTTKLIAGHPATVLTDLSRRTDLVVVGERGLGGLLFGSVASHLASHAGCPVVVVRGEPHPNGPVVVGVDGAGDSADALDFALEEASLRGTSLVALHAWGGGDWTELNSGLPMTYEFWSGETQEERVLAEALAGAAARYPDVPIRRQVARGHAGSLLTDWSHLAQLVVVGDRGHSGLTGLMLGSVSRHLIFHADCPTTIVRARSRVG
jgi:nucleotide-binding universal stress UspA family protein